MRYAIRMKITLIIVNDQNGSSFPARIARGATPALFGVSEHAQRKFWEFFTAHIRNPNTRRAYLIAAWRFADWCGHYGIPLAKVEPMVVAAYVEELTRKLAPASVKQHLAAIRMLFDWLVVSQIVPFNPATSVRGPKHVVKRGKTPVLSAEEARGLLDGIDLSTIAGLRDRALIGVLVFSFARISAAISMRVADYFTQGKRSSFRLHEKGGRYNVVPAHHLAQEYVDAYLEAAEVGDDRRGPLFRCCAVGRQDRLEDVDAYLEAAEVGDDRRGPLFRCCAVGRQDRLEDLAGDVAGHGAPDDQAPGAAGGTARGDLRAQLPGNRHHGISAERRRSRGRGADRRPRVDAYDAALQLCPGGDFARRDRAVSYLKQIRDLSAKLLETIALPETEAAIIVQESTHVTHGKHTPENSG